MRLIVYLVRSSGQIRFGTQHLDGFFCELKQRCVDVGLTMRIFGGASAMGSMDKENNKQAYTSLHLVSHNASVEEQC